MEGIQAGTLIWWSPLLSIIAPSLEDLVYVTLACLPPLCGSTSLGGRFFLSSITSFPFSSRFLFFSAGSSWGTWVKGRMESLAWIAFSSMLPPTWDSNRSKRLVLVLRCSTMAFGSFLGIAYLGRRKITEVSDWSFWGWRLVEGLKVVLWVWDFNHFFFFFFFDGWFGRGFLILGSVLEEWFNFLETF